MKIGKRFNILILAIAVICISIPVVLLVNYNRLNKLQDLRAMVLKTEVYYNKLAAYPGEILAYGFKLEKLVPDWEQLTQDTENGIIEIENNSDLSGLNLDVQENIERLQNLWKVLSENVDYLTVCYTNIINSDNTEQELSDMDDYGLQKAAVLSGDKGLSLALNVSRATVYSGLIIFGKDAFQILINKINTGIFESINKNIQIIHILGIVVALFSSVIVFIIIFIGTRGIIKRIYKLQEFTEEIYNKNLSVRLDLPRSDEIGMLADELNRTIEGLDTVLQQAKTSGNKARFSSEAIYSAAEETASATTAIGVHIKSLDHQFEKLMIVVSAVMISLKNMSGIVNNLLIENNNQTDNITQNTQEISEMSTSIDSIRKKSADKALSAEEIQQFITEGDDKINLTNKLLNEVSTNLEDIQNLVAVIDSISKQTNILSMNAAIESAHAGEAGKGFAVVAEEIRMLAETSNSSAKSIKKTVTNITLKVQNANEASDQASVTFDQVSEKVSDMLGALHEIADNVQLVDDCTRAVNDRTSIVAKSASKINDQYKILDKKQTSISTEMTNMQVVFKDAVQGLKKIDTGTSDIVLQMQSVNDLSRETSLKMQSLDKILSKFSTTEVKESPAVLEQDKNIDSRIEE